LRKCGIHWDDLGNSKGTADVEYERPEDAKAAIKEFNGIF
jgi:RNA recognition motif-containing protein